MRLKKIHCAARFDQSPWMAPNICMNTDLRKQTKSTFEQDLYKSMNNSVFGKIMENIRRRIDVKLVHSTEEEKLRKLIAKPSFNRSVMFDDTLAGIHMNKSKLRLDRPTYISMSILELSKNLMYDWYYNYLKNNYRNRVQLLYTDTDSLIMHI